MNKYDESYDIRLATLEDIPNIMQFINDYWKKGHILSVDRELFEYEYVYKDQVNFVLAVDKIKKTIEGLLGFLNASNPENIEKKDIWGSIWKVKEGNIPLLGIEIAKRLEILTKCRMELGSGLNPKTAVPLRKMFFKDNITKMKHYYFLNNSMKEYNIPKIVKFYDHHYILNNDVEIQKVDNFDESKTTFNTEVLKSTIPYKDLWYVKKRFYLHPYYQYNIYFLKKKKEDLYNGILVTREVNYKNSRVLRIVDYLGNRDLFQYLGSTFYELLIEKKYEYVDFYTYEFEEKYILNCGFVLKDNFNIIPNYFEPFEQKNVDIWINYPNIYNNVQFYKADADQDRPNILKQF